MVDSPDLTSWALELIEVEVRRPSGSSARGPASSEAIALLSRVSLRIQPGEIIAILGVSGAGKSTLLRLIAGLMPLSQGEVWLSGELIQTPHLSVATEERSLGVMSQEASLFPHLSVWENISFGVEQLGLKSRLSSWLSGGSRRVSGFEALSSSTQTLLTSLLNDLELWSLRERYPQTLSGGQRRRVALARAIARSLSLPKGLCLLDEPLNNLEPSLRRRILGRCVERLRREQTSIIWASHDRDLALQYADRVMILHEGQLIALSSPIDLIQRPPSRLVSELLETISWVHLSSSPQQMVAGDDQSLDDQVRLGFTPIDLGFHKSYWRLERSSSDPALKCIKRLKHYLTSATFSLALQLAFGESSDDDQEEVIGREDEAVRYQEIALEGPLQVKARVTEVKPQGGIVLISFSLLIEGALGLVDQESLILSAYLSTYSGARCGDLITLVYTGSIFSQKRGNILKRLRDVRC